MVSSLIYDQVRRFDVHAEGKGGGGAADLFGSPFSATPPSRVPIYPPHIYTTIFLFLFASFLFTSFLFTSFPRHQHGLDVHRSSRQWFTHQQARHPRIKPTFPPL